jgi:hypothetical protein
MVTMEHKESKPTTEQADVTMLNLSNSKIIEAMGFYYRMEISLNIIISVKKFHENFPSSPKFISEGQTAIFE